MFGCSSRPVIFASHWNARSRPRRVARHHLERDAPAGTIGHFHDAPQPPRARVLSSSYFASGGASGRPRPRNFRLRGDARASSAVHAGSSSKRGPRRRRPLRAPTPPLHGRAPPGNFRSATPARLHAGLPPRLDRARELRAREETVLEGDEPDQDGDRGRASGRAWVSGWRRSGCPGCIGSTGSGLICEAMRGGRSCGSTRRRGSRASGGSSPGSFRHEWAFHHSHAERRLVRREILPLPDVRRPRAGIHVA